MRRLLLVLSAVVRAGCGLVPGNSSFLRLFGRHVVGDDSGVSLRVRRTSADPNASLVHAALDAGGRTRFAVFTRANAAAPLVKANDFFAEAGDGPRAYLLADMEEGGVISLMKTSEDRRKVNAVSLFNLTLGAGLRPEPFPPPTLPPRRIDVYGDSDSAAYGIDANQL
eukprot:gene171-19892_t